MISIRIKQIIIFQGIEEHTGIPMFIDSTDSSLCPLGYTENIRFNIISYLKSAIMNDTNPGNYDGLLDSALQHPNFLEDALPHFGSTSNYN